MIAALFAIVTAVSGKILKIQAAPPRHGLATDSAAKAARVARGKYLVEGVAMCGTCHTPHTSSGNLDRQKWLDGAALWLEPATPTANWPLKAPRLAGTPPASDSELVTLLSTGAWSNGQQLRPPMPQFHMTREDAEAVVAYLRSLTPDEGR
jgi:mono/diheme cytochrome c family protein